MSPPGVQPAKRARLVVHPLTPRRWGAFVKLFGPHGGCADCWCLWWRLPRAEWTRGKSGGNRRAMRDLAAGATAPGLLAFAGRRAVGWIALAPRNQYVRLRGSRILKPVDDQPVWSVTCFFVAKEWRRRGVTVTLLQAAVDYARRHGAATLEGYPTDKPGNHADTFVFTGLAAAFRKAGFTEVARRSPTRPIFRCELR